MLYILKNIGKIQAYFLDILFFESVDKKRGKNILDLVVAGIQWLKFSKNPPPPPPQPSNIYFSFRDKISKV
jgi:hypothetical protein